MGNYLERPVLDLNTEQGGNGYLSYGCSSVQGWRCAQEDAHSATLDLTDGLSFFAVFDGHGGGEVAQYCSTALPSQFLQETAFTLKNDIGQALHDAFLNVDAAILTPAVKSILERLAEPKTENKTTSSENGECEAKSEDQQSSTKAAQKTRPARGRRRHRRKKPSDNEKSDFDRTDDSAAKQLIVDEVTELEIKGCIDSLLSAIDSTNGVTGQVQQQQQEADGGKVECISCSGAAAPAEYCDGVHQSMEESTSECSSIKKRPSSDIHDPSSPLLTTTDCTADETIGLSAAGVAAPTQREEGSRVKEDTPVSTGASDQGRKKPRREILDHNSADTEACINTDEKGGDITAQDENETDIIPDESTTDDTSVCVNEIVGESVVEEEEQEEDEEDEEEEEADNSEAVLIEFSQSEFDNDDDNEACDGTDDFEMDGAQKQLIMSELRTFRLLRELGPIRMIRPQKRNPGVNSGCTAIVAVVTNTNRLVVANAGDSRAVLCRNGEAIPLSHDHSPEVQEERERIEKSGHEITADGRVDGGLNLSRSLGDHTYKDNADLPPEAQAITCKPDLCEMEITSDDEFMVLACDGIWNCKSNQEVCDLVSSRLGANTLGGICEEVCSLCIAPTTDGDGTGCDNMTMMIVTFKPYSYEKREEDTRTEEDTESAAAARKSESVNVASCSPTEAAVVSCSTAGSETAQQQQSTEDSSDRTESSSTQ